MDRQHILKMSVAQEKRTAERYNGSRNVMSGAGWVRKNDVRTPEFLIENKFTLNEKSWTIKLRDLTELRTEALLSDRIPVLQFDLGGRRFVILNEDDFTEMAGL
jgi:hypothetical protein